MMREVVDYCDAANLPAHFHPSLDTGKRAQPLTDAIAICLHRFRRRDHRQHVPNVERAGQGRIDYSPFLV